MFGAETDRLAVKKDVGILVAARSVQSASERSQPLRSTAT